MALPTATINGPKIIAGLTKAARLGLPDTCTIRRVSRTSDGMGGQTDSWADEYTGIACRLEPFSAIRGGDEAIVAAKLTSLEPRVVAWASGQDVLVEDRIVIGSQVLEVKALLAPQSFELYRKAICEVVQ